MSASLAPECNQVKERYDTCFLKWYSEKYLRGTAQNDECEDLFKEYKTCLSKALKERGIDKMLDEARADNRENDAEHMKPSYFVLHYRFPSASPSTSKTHSDHPNQTTHPTPSTA